VAGRNSSNLESYSGAAPGELIPDLMSLVGVMPSRAGSAFDMKATLRIYEDDLRDLPAEMVRDAIKAFRRGELGGGHWCPTSGEIRRAVVERIEAKSEVERRAEAQEALDRETIAQRGTRERVAASRAPDWRESAKRDVEALQAELAAASGRRASALEWVKDCKPRPVTTFSEKLMAQLRGELPIGGGEARPFGGGQDNG